MYLCNSDNPLKRFLEGSDVPANPGGPAVGTVGGVVAFIQLGHKRLVRFRHGRRRSFFLRIDVPWTQDGSQGHGDK